MIGINQLVPIWLGFRQDTQPGEWINLFEDFQCFRRNTGPANAVKTVATGQPVAADFPGLPLISEADVRLPGQETADCDFLYFEEDLPIIPQARGNQVFDYLMLTVNG